MAAVSFSVGISGNRQAVVTATSAPGAGLVELRVDNTATSITDGAVTRAPRKAEIQQAVMLLLQAMQEDPTLPE